MSILSNSQLLRRKISLVLDELLTVSHTFTSHPRLADLYPEYLFTVHTMIRASVPLMEIALASAKAIEANDPVARGLATYLSKHIKEEMHHDDWLLDDLEVLGVERSQTLGRIPSPSVAALVGSQYYWIFHYHPVALLGYIAVMEGYPPTLEYIEELKKRTRYPDEAFRTLTKHGHLDPYHRDGLNKAVDDLPLEPRHQALISISAMQSVHFAAQAFKEIVEHLPKVTVASKNARILRDLPEIK